MPGNQVQMTSAVGEFNPVIALYCTRGMEAFLSNALQGILQTGIAAGQIVVGCPENALGSVASVTRLHALQVRVISTPELSAEAETEAYCNFGSPAFTGISWKKIVLVRRLLDQHPYVIYADLDVAWLRNPLPYLAEVASIYPMAFQTEALPRFPPALCAGFAFFAGAERTFAFLDALIAFRASRRDDEDGVDDQVAIQRLVESDPAWLHDIYCLPEALFPNGLGYRQLGKTGDAPCRMEGELQPFLFHANWTVGLDNKRKLLANTGTWFLYEQICSGNAAPGPVANDQGLPLFTLIFPVFEMRGEITERIRPWTEQDLNARRYRIMVVAGAETAFDDTGVRRLLRSHDLIVRIPGKGCDADYWNAGAREATTPWLLFVEAHTRPERDSLSALAAWIDANPRNAACNFTINNVEGGKIAALLTRWFAESHRGWAAPSTWPRLHRTAFAIRRDIFDEAGPFEPRYGQFAPALLSADLDRKGLSISLVPASCVNHFLPSEMSEHHADTADYVRGELEARVERSPDFFETYFGPSPSQGAGIILAARDARHLVRSLLLAAVNRPRKGLHMIRLACALLPAAVLNLRDRARMLAMATRLDEWLVMRSPMREAWRWERFLAAHRRVVRTEAMLWMARHQHELPKLQPAAEHERWPAATLGGHAVVGMHALERFGQDALRWSYPVMLLRLVLPGAGTLRLETRNIGRRIALSDIIVVAGARVLPVGAFSLDDTGNIEIDITNSPALPVETNIVIIVPELSEPSAGTGPGRRLGLPLFSIGFDRAMTRTTQS
jgi:Nucleotide-diphospho-sugar transferase